MAINHKKLKVGQIIHLFNSKEFDYIAKIRKLGKDKTGLNSEWYIHIPTQITLSGGFFPYKSYVRRALPKKYEHLK